MAERNTISACLIVRDEEKNICDCLDSMRHVVDEIIVVDTGSKDRTPELARAGGAQVFHFPWNDNFAEARNMALDKAKGEWILVLDADERLSWEDYASFRSPLDNTDKWGFTVRMVNVFEDRSSEVLLLRLFRNLPEVYYTGMIHERVDPSIHEATGNIREAIENHPAKVYHTGYQAQVKREKNKDERDIHLLKKQIEADRHDPFYRYKFAVHPYAREHLADEVEAVLEEAWTLVMEQDPESRLYSFTPEVPALRMLSALSRRDMELARELATESERFAFISPNLHYGLGQYRLFEMDLRCAASHFQSALAFRGRDALLAPIDGVTDFLSFNALSEVRYLQQRLDEAERHFKDAQASSSMPVTNLFLSPVRDVIENGDPGWALLVYSEAVRAFDSYTQLWQRGGELMTAMGFDEQARPWLEKAKALSPDPAGVEARSDC